MVFLYLACLQVCALYFWFLVNLELILLFETMANTPLNTNQEIPMWGTPCIIPLTGNVGVPLIATLNLPGFTLGIPVCLFSTPTILNSHDAYQVRSLHKGNQNNASPSPVDASPPPSTSCGESTDTSNRQSKRSKRKGEIGRKHISKGAPVQTLQVKLNFTTQPLLFMLGAPIQPLQVMLDLSIQPLLFTLVGSF